MRSIAAEAATPHSKRHRAARRQFATYFEVSAETEIVPCPAGAMGRDITNDYSNARLLCAQFVLG
jgi:hypothetical protein